MTQLTSWTCILILSDNIAAAALRSSPFSKKEKNIWMRTVICWIQLHLKHSDGGQREQEETEHRFNTQQSNRLQSAKVKTTFCRLISTTEVSLTSTVPVGPADHIVVLLGSFQAWVDCKQGQDDCMVLACRTTLTLQGKVKVKTRSLSRWKCFNISTKLAPVIEGVMWMQMCLNMLNFSHFPFFFCWWLSALQR